MTQKKINIIPKFLVLILFFFFTYQISLAGEFETGEFGITALPREGEKRGNFTYELRPGNEITDFIAITNPSKFTKKIYFFLKDFYPENDEKNPLIDSNKWVSFEENDVSVDPGQTKIVKFNLKLPPDLEQNKYIGDLIASDNKEVKGIINMQIEKKFFINIANDPINNDSEKFQEQDWKTAMMTKKEIYIKYGILIGGIIVFIILTILFIIFVKKTIKKKH
jgi:hypothetical protein